MFQYSLWEIHMETPTNDSKKYGQSIRLHPVLVVKLNSEAPGLILQYKGFLYFHCWDGQVGDLNDDDNMVRWMKRISLWEMHVTAFQYNHNHWFGFQKSTKVVK